MKTITKILFISLAFIMLVGCYDRDTSAYHPAYTYLSSIYEDDNGELYITRVYDLNYTEDKNNATIRNNRLAIMKFDLENSHWITIAKNISLKNIDTMNAPLYKENNRFYICLSPVEDHKIIIDISQQPYQIQVLKGLNCEGNDSFVFDSYGTNEKTVIQKYPEYTKILNRCINGDKDEYCYIAESENLYLFKDEHFVGNRDIIFELYTPDSPDKAVAKQKFKWKDGK